MNWNQFLQVIQPIPPTFWGVVAGAGFTLLGAWMTNRASLERQLKAQAEDRDIRRAQDEQAALRDVFLPAAEALTVGMNCVMRFVELDLPDTAVTAPYVERSAAVSKLCLLANSATVAAVSRFSTELNAAYARLQVRRLPLALQKSQLDFMARNIDASDKERDLWLESLKQDNLSWRPDARRRDAIERNLEREGERYALATKTHRRLFNDLFVKQCGLNEDCTRESIALRQAFVGVITAIRAELGLAGSQLEIEQTLAESLRRANANIAEMLDKVRRIIEQQAKQAPAPNAGRATAVADSDVTIQMQAVRAQVARPRETKPKHQAV